MNIRRNIVSQFKDPHGLFGMIAGFIMANRPSNIERNIWTLDLLALEPGDRLLEVGFGPGIAIEAASKVITEGFIVGIDHSEVMLEQSRQRNSQAIKQGAVSLFLGTVETLPRFDQPFTKICSANVVQFWSEPVNVFKKLKAMLASGGVIATTYMPRQSGATNRDAYKKANEVMRQLEAAGFTSIQVEEKPMKPVSAISVVAFNE